MLPTTFEFRWDAGHMIFFGAFYSVVTVVFTSLMYTVIKSIMDVYKRCKANDGQQRMNESELSDAGSEIGVKTWKPPAGRSAPGG